MLWMEVATKYAAAPAECSGDVEAYFASFGQPEIAGDPLAQSVAVVGLCLHKSGGRPPRTLTAKAYIGNGTPIAAARRGAVAVIESAYDHTAAWVGFVHSVSGEHVSIIGGDGAGVGLTLVPRNKVISFRWPIGMKNAEWIDLARRLTVKTLEAPTHGEREPQDLVDEPSPLRAGSNTPGEAIAKTTAPLKEIVPRIPVDDLQASSFRDILSNIPPLPEVYDDDVAFLDRDDQDERDMPTTPITGHTDFMPRPLTDDGYEGPEDVLQEPMDQPDDPGDIPENQPPPPADDERRKAALNTFMESLERLSQFSVADQIRYEIAMQAKNGSFRAQNLLVDEANERGFTTVELADIILEERAAKEASVMRAGAVAIRAKALISGAAGPNIDAALAGSLEELRALGGA